MNQIFRLKCGAYGWLCALVIVLIWRCLNVSVCAQTEDEGPGWLIVNDDPNIVLAEMGAPPPPALAAFAEPALAGAWTGTVDADFATDEVKELARGLQYDPLRIFNFVRNQIRYEHYYGCKKGAALTLLEKSGNDFDQCTLLVSLLREAAPANPIIGAVTYKYGMMTIPLTAANQKDLTHWLGLTSALQVAKATKSGGWPWYGVPSPAMDAATVYDDRAVLPRVCVEAVIDSSPQTLDPSFKTYTETTGIDLKSASNYVQGDFLTAAGGTSNGAKTQVSGMSAATYATFGTHLASLTTSLTNSLKTAPASGNASVEQVMGGRQIVTVESADYSSTAYFSWNNNSVLESWPEIPGVRASTIEIRAISGSLTWSAPLAELRGRRLALTFTTGTTKRAQIWLDDFTDPSMIETGAAGTEIELVTSIFHPFRDLTDPNGPASQSDALSHRKYQRSVTITGVGTFPGSYAILYAFDPGADHVRQREAKLAAYKAQGKEDDTREVRTETLNIMGLQWLRQSELAAHLIDRGTDNLRMNYQRVGRAGQEKGFYVDVGVQYVYLQQRQGDEAKRRKAFELGAYISSALEHGIVEQLQDGEAVSTVDLIRRALNSGGIVNRTFNGATSTLRPAVTSQTVGVWTGTGYASVTSSSAAMIISGNLNGGYGADYGTATSSYAVNNALSSPISVYANPPAQLPNFGADPVDLATGAFTYDHVDLALGGAEPRGLVFSRHYNSRLRQRDDAKLGFGWTHGYYFRSTKRSDGEAAFGAGTPAQAAAALVATAAAIDVYDIADPKKWATAMLALGWAVDRAKGNAISIQMGERNLQFIRQPSGAYVPPAGMPVSLTAITGPVEGYQLDFRHGNTVIFEHLATREQGRGYKIRDPYGKELIFAYNASDGTLRAVQDCYGRTFTLTYTGGKLTDISDGTGRSVSLGQDASGDLTTYTDPESTAGNPIVWHYDYLTGHLLEKTRDPDNRTIVRNIYDVFDRVSEQRTFDDATKVWKLFYSANATVEQDPTGGLRRVLYDDKHRLVGEIDAANRKVTYGYDGQDHRTSVTTPNQETTTTLYDANHNPTLTTDPLSKTVQLFYDGILCPDYTIDKRGKTTDYTYNSYHQLAHVETPEHIVTDLTYYPVGNTHAGLPYQRKTYGMGGPFITAYEYDTNGYVNKITYPNSNFETFANNVRGDVTSHVDLRGGVAGYSYNKRRQLLVTTLPTVNGVSYYLENVYDNEGNLWKQYDKYRNLTTTTHSATQKPLVTTFNGDPETVTRTYDKRDWLEKTIDTRSKENRIVYYPDGRTQQTYDRLSRQRTNLSYNSNGQSLATKTPMPNASGGWATVTHSYNARGELWKATDAFGDTEFTPDENGNLRYRKDRRGHTWEFTYNGDNQIEDAISPVTTRKLQKRYDNRGLLHTDTEPSGQLTTYTPDSLGRVASVSDSVSNISYTYDDGAGVHTHQESTTGAPLIKRYFDPLARLIKYEHGSDYTLEWIYHDSDSVNKNAFSLKYPDGKLVRYDFDSRGRLKTVKDWNNKTTTYQYDNVGRLEWTYRPNGTSRHVTYDDAGEITKIEELNIDNKVIALFGYPAYWNNGQPAKEFSVPALPLGAKVHPASMTFGSDNRILTWNSQTVDHDDDGNIINGPLPPASAGPGQPSPGFATYNYDARNRLTTLGPTAYSYDAENLRTAVTTTAGATNWVLNPTGAPPQPLVRTLPGGAITRYVWSLGLLYEVADGDTQPAKTYHYDRRGSTVALSNADGRTISDRWAYGPYGERLSHTGPSDTPFQFNGFFGVQTDANGLLYMNARYYNVELHRFISADPMGFGAGANFYWFANGDPISLADPFGLGAQDTSGSSILSRMGQAFYVSGRDAANTAGGILPNIATPIVEVAGAVDQVVNAGLTWAFGSGSSLMAINPAEAALLGTLSRVAPAANNTTPLYRAVMNPELDDIVSTGVFRNPAGIEQKYFSATAEGAASYAKQAFGKMGDTSPYTIIRTDAPTSLLSSVHSVDRGVPAILVPTNSLPKLSPPQVLPYSPYPR